MIESIDESEIDQSHDHENKEWDHKCHVMNLESSTILMLTVQPRPAPASSACGCRPPQRRYHLKSAFFRHLATIINNFFQNEAIQNQLRSFVDSANDLFTHQSKSFDYGLAV